MSSAGDRRAALSDVVFESARLLDERRWGEWIDLTAPEFRYRIEAYSPELRKNMTWLEHDRGGMIALIELLPRHHIDGSDWLRQVSLGRIDEVQHDEVATISSLAIFRTVRDIGDSHVDGGSTQVFLVGHYHDRFRSDGERWLLSERTVKLHTRQLGVGSHLFP